MIALKERWAFKMKPTEFLGNACSRLKVMICGKSGMSKGTVRSIRKQIIFEKGKKKIMRELDVVNIITKLRQLELLSNVLLTDS